MNTKKAEKILRALANARRIEIVKFLKRRKVAIVGEISEAIKLSFKSTSRHLTVLSSAGILDREQQSLFVHYRIASPMSSLSKAVYTLL